MTRQSKLPKVIPPRSVFRLVRTDRHTPAWRGKIGQRCRVNYYNPRHGYKEIMLLDDQGRYFTVVDGDLLARYFRLERLSTESDLFGVNHRPIGPIRRKGVIQDLRARLKRQRLEVRLPFRWSSKIISRFKQPVARQLRMLGSVLRRMEASRRSQPPFHFFTWPEKMHINCFAGDLERLLKFLTNALALQRRTLCAAVKRQDIADWQVLVIKSRKKPDILWLATHRMGRIMGDPDIWPEFGIQRVGKDKYLAWKWKPKA